ncbi:MAG: hypothetical protein PHS85_01885 [Sulfurovum sp.]|nr:hypothetical protein [Sulfurovum sp.]
MSETKKTEPLMSIEEFEKKVKEILKKSFEITYDSERKDNKALSIYINSALIVDVMQPTWQKVFNTCLKILKDEYGANL